MPYSLLLVLTGAPALLPPNPVIGRVTIPREAAGQPVLVVLRDSARGVTHAVSTRDGRFAIPVDAGAAAVARALTLDGKWTAETPIRPGTLELRLERAATPARRPSSSSWLARLPEGEMRRRFILDCTGCHQFDDSRARKDGAPRQKATWTTDLGRMLQYAGPRSNFPVISAWAEGTGVADWLAEHVVGGPVDPPAVPLLEGATVTEYDTPVAADLPHDVAVDSSGAILVTGMFSHVMFRLEPATGRFERVEIPLERSNPRAVELDRDGNWWVLHGGPNKVGRYDVRQKSWKFFDIGLYPHSITVAHDGRVWYNGHFSRDPERIGVIDPAAGTVTAHDLPLHPTMAKEPGGPIPYEQRVGPDGRIWVSELQGNRIVEFDPKTGASKAHTLPTTASGPRRFDVDARGILWIPGYSANTLVRFDPATAKFTEYPLPLPGATPYIARVDRRGAVWIGTSAADAAFRFDPNTAQFRMIPLPSQGALVRHLTIDPRSGDVWLAYGASPARIPARIARIRTSGAR